MNTHSRPMKSSGLDWVGEIPAHWDIARVKNVARLESGHTPSRSVPEHWLDTNDIPWVSLNDTKALAEHDYISETAYYINALGLQNSSARLLPAHAVVFTRDATIGKAAITTRPMAVSQHLIAWICGPRIVPEYLLYVFYAMERALDQFTFGATIKTIGMGDVRELATPVPPVNEQRCVVSLLRARLVKVDELIAKKERLVELLAEKRQALITQAVTKGLDPGVPMKESGVEWIGRVPAHWSILNLGRVSECRNGVNKPAEAYGSGVRYVTVNDLYGKDPQLDQGRLKRVEVTSEERRVFGLRYHDLLLGRSSVKPEGVGSAALLGCPEESTVFSGFTILLRLNLQRCFAPFVLRLLQIPPVRGLIIASANTVAQTNLSQDKLKTLLLALPPVEEQRAISEYVEREIAQSIGLTECLERSSSRLREYRQSLITAAVTGKLDLAPATEASS